MDMFCYWREFQGENNNYLLLLSFLIIVECGLMYYFIRRDSRKVVLLQHGILDSSMGCVPNYSWKCIDI
jgi:hypothetical protein